MSDYSVLLMAYGQSNADLYPAIPAQPCAAFDDPRIVTFDDGSAFRGLLGGQRKVPVTALVPAAAASYETKKCRNYQSFQIAAAARVLHEGAPEGLRHLIVRAEGRGGRRFHGIVKNERHIEGILNNADGTDSQILLNLHESIAIAADLAAQSGAPLRRIIVNFIHGEADRGTPRAIYLQNFQTLMDRVAQQAERLGVPLDWLILDPAGTSSRGSGSNWPCRLAMQDVADAARNVHLIGGGYAYELDDVIHYSSESRALFGEHFGAAIAALLARDAGQPTALDWLLNAPRPKRAVLSGPHIDLHLDGSEDFQLIAGISDPNLNIDGFDVTLAAKTRVQTVQQTGPRSVRVTLERPPAGLDRAALTYAYQLIQGKDSRMDSRLPAGRGGWRSERALHSIVLPGRSIHQWVPGFVMPFAQMEEG